MLAFLKSTGQLFWRMSLSFGFSDVSLLLASGFAFLWEYHTSDMFSVQQNRRYMILVCPTISDVKFDYLIKVDSTRFLHCKFTIFSFYN